MGKRGKKKANAKKKRRSNMCSSKKQTTTGVLSISNCPFNMIQVGSK